MTEERLRFIERCCLPKKGSTYHSQFMELLKEVHRARQSERICRAAAIIYKRQLNPIVLRKSA